MGVKIRIEMFKADTSLHALKGGANLLNHTIKNEIGKVDLLLHQIRHSLQAQEETIKSTDIEVEEMLDMATDSVHHIQSMMIKMSEKFQSTNVHLQKKNLMPTLEQCLETLKKTLGPNISVVCTFKAMPDVYHDAVHMKEVIYNIMNNAVESMDCSGVITIGLKVTSREIVLQFQDEGKGIAKKDLPAVFEPFYSTKQVENHYGLGLFYCKNVITKHNGSIHVDSTPGKGSTFYIHLQK